MLFPIMMMRWKMNKENYKIEKIDICPDCGCNLEVNFCHMCEIKWVFAKDKQNVGGKK